MKKNVFRANYNEVKQLEKNIEKAKEPKKAENKKTNKKKVDLDD